MRGNDYTNAVLLVEDDLACLDECGETLANLGYEVKTASDALGALKIIAEDPSIGIVLTDLNMPGMDGLTFLEELSLRFMPQRPIVALVLTAVPTLEAATLAMRSHAVDFLSKPVSAETLAAALRRASANLAALATKFQIVELAKNPANDEEAADEEQPAVPSSSELQDFVGRLLKHQQNRAKFFDPDVFSGPSWDILLDLAEANFRGTPVAASSVCASTQVPLSTALRHVNSLVEAGLVKRWTDPSDKRRKMLELAPEASELMKKYLETSWKIHAC